MELNHTMEAEKFVIDCRKLKKDAAFEYNRKYGRYAVKIQALVRGVLNRIYKTHRSSKCYTTHGTCVVRKKYCKRAKAHLEREENKLENL